MESDSKPHHKGIGLFLTGVVVGAAVTLGLGNVEGKRMALRLAKALRELSERVREKEVPVRPQLPSPPTITA